MDVLAVVPALDRGALRPLVGRPLVAHTIEQARRARSVTRVAVVTSILEVARHAEQLGAAVVEVAAEGQGTGGPCEAIALAADVLAQRESFVPQAGCVLEPAYPLRTPEDVDAALNHLYRCGADTLVSVHALANRLWVQEEGGSARLSEGAPGQRRYVDNGAVLALRLSAVEPATPFPAGRVVLFEMPVLHAFRLRCDDDWPAAEALVRNIRGARTIALLKPIELLVLDFDGVMTDNRVIVFDDGREGVLCNRSDGLGCDRLQALGFPVAVISKERNPVVGARCRKLNIPCEQGITEKLPVLEHLAREKGLSMGQVAYMGNDVNDLECLRACGVAIAPSDAVAEVLKMAALVTNAPGGMGAVREICDALIAARTETGAMAD